MDIEIVESWHDNDMTANKVNFYKATALLMCHFETSPEFTNLIMKYPCLEKAYKDLSNYCSEYKTKQSVKEKLTIMLDTFTEDEIKILDDHNGVFLTRLKRLKEQIE